MPSLNKITGTLGSRRATHLLRRATFGPTSQDIVTFSAYTIDQAMDVLFTTPAVPAKPIDPQTGSTWLNPKAGGSNSPQEDLIQYFIGWHLELMRASGNNIRERIVWFLHSHIPAKISKVMLSESLYYQNALYRYYAMGSFKTMFRKLCVENAMLRFLDNDTNDVNDPNENFAREMLELYSIGRGEQMGEGDYTNYTEDDIKAATRILTGYEVDEEFTTIDAVTGLPTGRLRYITDAGKTLANRHDAEPKQFSAHFGNRVIQPAAVTGGYATVAAAEGEMDEMIDMIFDEDATAEFLCKKLYRQFVYYKTEGDVLTDIINPLGQLFKSSDYNIPTVLRKLLSSEHFFDMDDSTADDIQGSIIKSPIELVLGVCRLFKVTFPVDADTLYKTVYQKGLIPALIDQGINLYEPFEVAGYPAYHQFPNFNRNWISPYYMAYRYLFANLILAGSNGNGDPLGIQIDLLNWVEDTNNISDPSNATAIVERLSELFFAFTPDPKRIVYFRDKNFIDVDTINQDADTYWSVEWSAYKDGGGDSTVKSLLTSLFNGMMQSPEFQLI